MNCIKCQSKVAARGLCAKHYKQARKSGEIQLLREDADQEFLKKRIKISDDGCWIWQKSTREGYGRFLKNGKAYGAHVFSYLIYHGKIENGLQVNHTCHNRTCVNPDHLYAGTQKQNVSDMQSAGRANYKAGEENGNSRITEGVAKEIYKAEGVGRVVAEKFGVSISLVYAIKKKQIWKNIHE